jgi:hypothetical protein
MQYFDEARLLKLHRARFFKQRVSVLLSSNEMMMGQSFASRFKAQTDCNTL